MTEKPSGTLVLTAATVLLLLVAACPASLEANSTCEFNRSTQHLLAVYWQGSGTLKFFAVVG